jgi:voltage-gated potassium channel
MDQKPRGRLAGLSDFQRRQRFVFLFGGLLLLLVMAPLLEKTNSSRELLAGITTLILFSGIYSSLKESSWLLFTMSFLGALSVVTVWWEYAFWSIPVVLTHYLGLVIFFFLMIITILRDVSRATSVNPNVIYGAVSVYLLLAFIWGLLFAILFILEPGSFRNLVVPFNSQFSVAPFWYLSFLTITTLGYSDVAPASGMAQSLAMIEAVVGQLYLVLQVSLLVGLRVSEVAAQRHQKG